MILLLALAMTMSGVSSLHSINTFQGSYDMLHLGGCPASLTFSCDPFYLNPRVCCHDKPYGAHA